MSKAKIILVGAGGRMGRTIFQYLRETGAAEVAAQVGRSGFGALPILSLKPKKSTVVVDFSTPDGFVSALQFCMKNKMPLVSGTTGLSKKHQNQIQKASKSIPILWAPNMSFGVVLFAEIIEKLGAAISSYDFQIEEFHHKNKKDSPSGTALRLQETLSKASGKIPPPILSGRGGGIYGTHKLWLMGEEEVLTIEHTALSRTVFARGAIAAANWLQHKGPGQYSMMDVIRGKK